MTRIDAHHHFWALKHGFQPWIEPGLRALSRDRLAEDLAPLIREAGIGRTIVVQTAETPEETRLLFRLSAPFVAGVVGWLDLTANDFDAQLHRLRGEGPLVGIRPMLQDQPSIGWLFDAQVDVNLRALARSGLAFDALIRPHQLRPILRLARMHPELRIVIDHAAKPLIAWRGLDSWAGDMREIAHLPNVFCKLSGMINNAGDAWDAAKLAPYFEVLIESFGAWRLMYGSDWPMVDLSGDYQRWFHAVEELTTTLPDADRARIFGGTAASFYGV